MRFAFHDNKKVRVLARCLAAGLLAMGLPACSMGYQNLGSPASLAYQAPDTASIQQDVRQGIVEQIESSLTPEKTFVAAVDPKSVLKKPQGPALDTLEARDLINSYRQAKGLKPLIIHPQLTQAAENHSKDLAKQDSISHYGKDGSNPWDRVKRTGYNPRVAAENVGTGQVTLREVLKGWKESPSHNENLLLSDASHMGIALVSKPGSKLKTFWTLVVGSPL